MKNYSDWKERNSGSAILEALNRGSGANVSSFNSVDQFIHGILGPNLNRAEDPRHPGKENFAPPQNSDMPKETTASQHVQNPPVIQDDEMEEISMEEETEENKESVSSGYKVYRDKEESFECNIQIQGAKLSSSQARLVFDHEICNIVFYGKVYKDGKCIIPLKKMTFYPEGSSGRIRLEVIVDDTIFIPWEETFTVEGAKKVSVQIKPQKKINFSF